MNIILASNSPRRKELLTLASIPYTVIPADCDESLSEGIAPNEAVTQLALRKAENVFKNNQSSMIIAADTVVALGNTILGKPADEDDAFRMLTLLSGKTHSVYTGVCIMTKEKTDVFFSKTQVNFYDLTEKEISDYIKTKEPFDKAGSYGIQGKGSLLVKGINGDYFNVVGLPIAEVVQHLKNF